MESIETYNFQVSSARTVNPITISLTGSISPEPDLGSEFRPGLKPIRISSKETNEESRERERTMAPSSSSGLTFKLHPLVIVNISDHYTRVKTQLNPPPSVCATENASSNNGEAMLQPNPRVYGCVIGVQRGRTVEIFNSFELLFDPSTETLDRSFLEKKQELYKKVFPDFYVLGWYSTGSDAEESDMLIHKALMDINESPVYVLLNPAINHAQKDLPTVEAERISVDHVAHLKPSDGGSAATQLAAHLTGIHSAIKMLNSRIRVLHQYLAAMEKGDIPCENSLLRQVSSLLRRLPAMESESTMNEMVDKFNIAYDRNARRGGRTAFM
ncbi:hypothetical protein Bca101_032405 [Brassica carinata]